MLLKQLGTQTASASPGIDVAQLILNNRLRNNSPDIRILGSRPHSQNPGVIAIAIFIFIKSIGDQGIDSLLCPDSFGIDLVQFQLHLFPMLTLQPQNTGIGSFADNGEHIDPQVIKDQASTTHGGDIKSTPRRRKPCKDQTV